MACTGHCLKSFLPIWSPSLLLVHFCPSPFDRVAYQTFEIFSQRRNNFYAIEAQDSFMVDFHNLEIS